jgi:hypothetical protein
MVPTGLGILIRAPTALKAINMAIIESLLTFQADSFKSSVLAFKLLIGLLLLIDIISLLLHYSKLPILIMGKHSKPDNAVSKSRGDEDVQRTQVEGPADLFKLSSQEELRINLLLLVEASSCASVRIPLDPTGTIS